MPFDLDKIMFEVYKEATYSGKYRVVYFTELQDHNKEAEINRAMAGEHFFDGFIRAYRKDQAKETIEKLLNRLNEGEAISKADFETELKPFTPS
jgi:type I restriction-modification system DNA methylase subunit